MPSRLSSVGFEASREDRDSYPWPWGLRRASSPAGWDQDKAWTEELTVSGVSLPAAQILGEWAAGQQGLRRLIGLRIIPMIGSYRSVYPSPAGLEARRRAQRSGASPPAPGIRQHYGALSDSPWA